MEHLARIQRAVDFIEVRLKEDLPTDAIAREAGFSMWHFQRVFSAAVGDTVKDYVRKRRLSMALKELLQTDRRILDVAIDYQFESQESFSRAFKGFFGITPGESRTPLGEDVQWRNKPRITIEYLDHLYGGMTMQPKIVTLKEKKVVGMGANFISILSPEANNFTVIPKLWDAYMKKDHEISNRVGKFDLGLCTAVVENRNHKHECYYMACTEVTDLNNVPEGMEGRVVPAGRYAVFTHKGKLNTLEHTMKYIYGSWLPRSGEQLREAPDLEMYDERFKLDQDDSEIDLYIPIK